MFFISVSVILGEKIFVTPLMPPRLKAFLISDIELFKIPNLFNVPFKSVFNVLNIRLIDSNIVVNYNIYIIIS